MLNRQDIEKFLKTSYFGRYLYIFPELESTNTFARKLIEEGAPEGTVVLADYQSAGKGRFGRSWYSSRAVNILMSLILRPRITVEAIQNITMATANILIDSFHQFLQQVGENDIAFTVKWPNDILVQGKKIAGILVESGVKNKSVEFVIIGMGINVNQDIQELDAGVKDEATSFYTETGRTFSRENLIVQLLYNFERKYIELERSKYEHVIADWKKHCAQIGKDVLVETPLLREAGRFIDVDEQGWPIYQTRDGQVKKLITGRLKTG